MTLEEKQKAEKAAADKTYYLKMTAFHDGEATHYRDKASACDPTLELVSGTPRGNFGGL